MRRRAAAFRVPVNGWSRRADTACVPRLRGDSTWAAMVEAAERLNREPAGLTHRVSAARQRSWTTLTVIEGFVIGDKWTDAFEPVRRRRMTSTAWTDIQPLEKAAATVGRFLRERPDLR